MSRSRTIHSFREFLRNDSGTTAIEYALIASAIAGVLIAVVMGMGTQLQAKYQSVSDGLN